MIDNTLLEQNNNDLKLQLTLLNQIIGELSKNNTINYNIVEKLLKCAEISSYVRITLNENKYK